MIIKIRRKISETDDVLVQLMLIMVLDELFITAVLKRTNSVQNFRKVYIKKFVLILPSKKFYKN